MPEAIDVVVRCRNEMPHVRRTLSGLSRQLAPRARLLFVDCASTDGSRESAVDHGAVIVDLERAAYIPGAVLNLSMERTNSDIVAFVNADAVPLNVGTLASLIAPFRDSPAIAATYGRQRPRVDATRLTRADHNRIFGEHSAIRIARGPFFSMAASAVRRKAWEQLRFDETMAYSEDVDWIRRVSALGWEAVYVADAAFEKSREYGVRGHFRRRAGEGTADTFIYHLGQPSVVRDLIRPLGGAVARDACAGHVSAHSIIVRSAQAGGYFVGRTRGNYSSKR